MFANGQQRVSADIEMLLPGVLRVSVPYITTGNWRLSVVNRAGETVAEESSSCFVVSPEGNSLINSDFFQVDDFVLQMLP